MIVTRQSCMHAEASTVLVGKKKKKNFSGLMPHWPLSLSVVTMDGSTLAC